MDRQIAQLGQSYREGESIEKITDEVIRIRKEHGCQVIVNGVLDTLKYYLRLVKTPATFVGNYVTLVEKDPVLRYEHKMAWDDIVISSHSH